MVIIHHHCLDRKAVTTGGDNLIKLRLVFFCIILFLAAMIPSAHAALPCQRITTSAHNCQNPAIAATHEGLSYIAWEENVDGNREIFLCRVDDRGRVDEQFGNINVSNTVGSSQFPDISVDDAGNCYLVWQEVNDIYFSVVTPTGAKLVDKKVIDAQNCSNPRISTITHMHFAVQ